MTTFALTNGLARNWVSRCYRRILQRDAEFFGIVEQHDLINHVDDSVAGFDVDFDDLRTIFCAVSLSFLVELLLPAHAASVLPVGHFDGFLASQVIAVDDLVLDRVEGQYCR